MKKKNVIIFSAIIGAIAVTGITLGLVFGLRPKINYITYTLDSDITLKKVNHDIEIVDNPNVPGKSIAHKDRSNDIFNLLVFTDLHLDHKQELCNYTFSMLARNIMHANPIPDLVVFCGDNITSSYNEPRTHQFCKLLEDLGVYWCAVLGNHEKNAKNPYSIERDKMINIFCSYPHCLIDNKTKKTNDGTTVWGVGNSIVNLVSDNGITQTLYFLDSGTEMTNDDMIKYQKEIQWYIGSNKARVGEYEFYDYIKDSQVNWYIETFNTIQNQIKREGKELTHSTIFTHVPLIEHERGYLKLFNNYESATSQKLQGIGAAINLRAFTDFPQDSSECRTNYAYQIKDLYGQADGFIKGRNMRRREDICYSPHDVNYFLKEEHTPIFKAMQNFGTNNALFCGHDHQNNFAIKYDDVILGYIQPACYSSNNLFTKGMLGKDPTNPEATGKYDGNLIQGYSQINYKHNSVGESNVITDLKYIENYSAWKNEKPELYPRIINLLKNTKEYLDRHEYYLDGNEN